VALVRERTIPTEWPPPVGEVSAVGTRADHVTSLYPQKLASTETICMKLQKISLFWLFL